MNLTPGTGKSENLISRYQTHQLHQDLIRHFGSLEDGLIAMLDQKGDPYTLVRRLRYHRCIGKGPARNDDRRHAPLERRNEFLRT